MPHFRGMSRVTDHDQQLAKGFDAQAPKFERAPAQSDPAAIERLVHEADFPPGARVLDAGCGPGLVSSGLLDAGLSVLGVDLSTEMVERARKRCAAHGERARFVQGSVYDPVLDQFAPFDGALSRFVLHHVVDPGAFLARQVALVRSGGVIVACDHTTDPNPEIAAHHNALEIARDRTHTRNLTGGELVDLFARAGLQNLTLVEEPFILDFDEWFDRGTPGDTKESVRGKLLSGAIIRTFRHSPPASGGSVRIDCIRAIVRGVKP
jgi:2-polyprenyl-3-methyl-5-hydroxy-6-metoxy-1,4-benzoquinol methylase